MKIKGWQKLSLLDYPKKTSTILFLGGCNLRCPYCHNMELLDCDETDDLHNEKEIMDFLDKRIGLLEGVVISGGEPTTVKGIVEFIRKIKDKGFLVKLDTNGFFPDVIEELLGKELIDYIAMDIKNCKDRYKETVGLLSVNIKNVTRSIEIIKNSKIDYEFRTTVTKEYHTERDLRQIVNWIKGSKKWFIQQYRDSPTNLTHHLRPIENKVIDKLLPYAEQKIDDVKLRGFQNLM